MLDRSTRTFWGVGFLVAAILVTLWLIVRERPVEEWWLALLLFLIAGLLFLWGRRSAAGTAEVAPQEAAAPRVHEFAIQRAEALAPAAPVLTTPEPEPKPEPPPAPLVVEAAPIATFAKAEPAPVAPIVPEKPAKPDDLLVIEGIGPKMDKALRTEGIDTYRKVADASVQDLRAAIETHGLTFAPSLVNWSKQARYLAEGDQSGFETYRNYLIRGLEPGQVVSRDYVVTSEAPATAAEPAKTSPKKAAASKPKQEAAPKAKKAVAPKAEKKPKAEAPKPVVPDDLKVVEGIGPKMEKALHAAGILTYKQLAAASVETIQAAIIAGGLRFAPSAPTWARQAEYAAKGDFDGMKAYQDTLTAGRAT
jgi:predicted flap endonuclease-1-like 5' DNA nuclease